MIEDIRLTLSKNFFPLSQFDNNFKNTNYLTLKNLLKNVAIEVSKLFHNDDYYTEAPFKKTDGDPYLEVHHIKQLAKGGPDTAMNAVALCPNCHKEAHYGEKAEEIYVRLLANSTISPKTNPPPIRHQI